MGYNVNKICRDYDFIIEGASYAGEPRNNTMMYISKKVEHLVENLQGKERCLVFLENGIEVSKALKETNCFIFSDNPQYAYAEFATQFAIEQRRQEMEWGYTLTDEGYFLGHNVSIGENAYIEPGVLIGHNVTIGKNAVILAGAVIKHTVIGDDFLCNENAVIGANGFIMALDESRKIRIPSLGRVVIGNDVEVGAHDNISRGSGMNTIIDDNVKLDALVHIGHDVHICSNAEIVAGSVVGGFDVIGKNSFIGINASLRNRIEIGNDALVGMGATVTKSIDEGCTVVGNPAHALVR